MNNKIRSVDDGIRSVFNTGLERGEILFRGQANFNWEINPSVFRHFNFGFANKYEIVLFESMLSGNHNPYTLSFDPVEHLIILQHFQIHTRLLDWTSDVLVALFFSCYDFDNSNENIDGNLIMIQRNHYPSYNMNSQEKHILNNPPRDQALDFFKKRLSIDQVYILEPLIKNPRMRNQDGLFMFFPFLPISNLVESYVTLHTFMRARNEVIRKRNAENPDKEEQLIWIANKLVDKDSKKTILRELDEKYGINYSSLFVENDFVNTQKAYFDGIRSQADKKLEWLINIKRK